VIDSAVSKGQIAFTANTIVLASVSTPSVSQVFASPIAPAPFPLAFIAAPTSHVFPTNRESVFLAYGLHGDVIVWNVRSGDVLFFLDRQDRPAMPGPEASFLFSCSFSMNNLRVASVLFDSHTGSNTTISLNLLRRHRNHRSQMGKFFSAPRLKDLDIPRTHITSGSNHVLILTPPSSPSCSLPSVQLRRRQRMRDLSVRGEPRRSPRKLS